MEMPAMMKSHAILMSVYCDLQLGKIKVKYLPYVVPGS